MILATIDIPGISLKGMRLLSLTLLLCFSPGLFSHSSKKNDSADKRILYEAYFQGLLNRDSIKIEELIESKKMLVRAQGMKVNDFYMTIDCDACDLVMRHITSDSFSAEDIQYIRTNKNSTLPIITFERITATANNGQVFRCKAFYFWFKK